MTEPVSTTSNLLIYGEISADPTELRELADAIIRGASIANARIENVRAVIDALHEHQDSIRSPSRAKDDLTPATQAPERAAQLTIRGGEILHCDCRSLEIRVIIDIASMFTMPALFDDAVFESDASFSKSCFGHSAVFGGVVFEAKATFRQTHFMADSSFYNATFGHEAQFSRANFEGNAMFTCATFENDASFGHAEFASSAWFEEARFEGYAWFSGANFAGDTSFATVVFAMNTSFQDVYFAQVAIFNSAIFCRDVRFSFATFAGHLIINEATCAETFEFSHTHFKAGLHGDLRRATVRTTKAHSASIDDCFDTRVDWGLTPRLLPNFLRRMYCGSFGWQIVRALGGLQILNRVSLVALISVPVLAACWPAVRAASGAYHRELTQSRQEFTHLLETIEHTKSPLPQEVQDRITTQVERARESTMSWEQRLAELAAEDPRLSFTLALTFSAAVLVTLGLLIYQTSAPEEIKRHDEEAFVRDYDGRYPEGSAQRRDGLRRSIEALENIAKVRFSRHPRFVSHHGDTVWIPPKERPEWFDDAPDPIFEELRPGSIEQPENSDRPKPIPSRDLDGYVPGAERARICVEEGARAEYWLKAHEKITRAWVSFVLYALGIICLLTILIIQIVAVWREAL